MDWKHAEHLCLEFGTGEVGEASDIYTADMTLVDDQYIHTGSLLGADGNAKHLESGQLISGYIVLRNDTRYYFDSEVVSYDAASEQAVFRRPDEQELTETRSRKYLRVRAELELAVKCGDQRFTVLTTEVSAGGLVFVPEAGMNVQRGDSLECWLLIHMKNGAIEHVPLEAIVLSSSGATAQGGRCKIEYTAIASADQQKLIRYCFERQFDFRT
ncbi:PilZ domain-containing protein [Paenibacillus kandeliae]|uniref:PilZ domain-containing protein n=1 Tax=Paenibacillus kandeliae TaxID=3231269 RepID=UPI003457ED88